MRGRAIIQLVLGFLLLSCGDEDISGKIQDHQVERLLSGQTGTKMWDRIINSTDCSDSLKLTFTLVENSAGDSLDLTLTAYESDCSTQDFLTRANASVAEDNERFTDSLIFSNGDFWIISEITSQRLLVEIENQPVRFSSVDN